MKIGRREALIAYLEPAQATALRKLSKKTRVPMQAYLREGVDLALAYYRGKRHEPNGGAK